MAWRLAALLNSPRAVLLGRANRKAIASNTVRDVIIELRAVGIAAW